jgi:transposase-like protein
VAKAGPRKIAKYGERFKATAVKLSSLPGLLIQDVAAALDTGPRVRAPRFINRHRARAPVGVNVGLGKFRNS